MDREDFVFNQIIKGCNAAGVRESIAQGAALTALDKYKKGKYQGKPIKLISDAIGEAKKQAKKLK